MSDNVETIAAGRRETSEGKTDDKKWRIAATVTAW